ncbi:peptidylprolyl isomerase [Hymenobacter amundsenii]|uniref:Peptidyl-prolyl cis-trans isomerase n=1 Tax=Hymenobacter amundsenii TaxID=2006685 RepID=A0A246FI33_9BACT|nr:FKBP-type peptidyl-prolyl cis-trans isomerase [Hymenobacter amundsenii]OWP62181.1 peptidylprolyl isomerase [Hymenobacter amundsenii]
MKRQLPLFLLLLLALLSACKKEEKDTTDYAARDEALITAYIQANNLTGFERKEKGLYLAVTQPGTGPVATAGKTVKVKYKGTTLDGNMFDQSNPASIGFPFVLGAGNVIEGWDVAFALLNKGSKAILLIPSELAYKGTSPSASIPAHAVLRFDVEVVDIQ